MIGDLEVRDYRPEDTGAILALMQQGLGAGPGGTREESFWRWKHIDNPFGPSIALVAANPNHEVVGLRTFMRWRFKVAGKTLTAVRAVDTVTHPEYRRYGVFSALTKQAVEQARNSGVALIFNTPNKHVLPGYLKLGWHYVSMVRPLVKVLNYPRFVAGLIRHRKERSSLGQLPAGEIFPQGLPSAEEFLGASRMFDFRLIADGQARNGHLFTERSAEYLRWRYSQYPYASYVVLHRKKSSTQGGLAVLRANSRFGLREVVLSELLLSGQDEDVASSVLSELVRSAKADYIIAYFARGSFERHILQRHGFHQVPRAGMNFAVNVLSPDLPCDPLDLGNWDLGLGDLEVF